MVKLLLIGIMGMVPTFYSGYCSILLNKKNVEKCVNYTGRSTVRFDSSNTRQNDDFISSFLSFGRFMGQNF